VCKLLSTGTCCDGQASAYVQPTLVPVGQPESAVPMNYNLITLVGKFSGRMSFFGQGAGRYPTAYNVVQDCADLLAGKGFYSVYGPKISAKNQKKLRYYVRGGLWQGGVTETWGSGIVTEPVSVDAMHAWRKDYPDAFIAAIAEEM
jgi:homoserine dehydrogenase